MKLGVLTNLIGDQPLDSALAYFESLGLDMVEIGCAGYPGNQHADPAVLLNDAAALEEFKATVKRHNLEISALSCHGNPIHPDKATAAEFDKGIRDTILLAEKLGIHQINTFSGCPGDCEDSKYPNWVTCAWPTDFQKVLDWQWNDVLIPYWKKTAAFALEHGVDKIALELHPGFCVYNTQTMLRLRDAVGPVMGANLDPSHLIWQGMDLPQVIAELGDCIFHFHAKDTKIDPVKTARTGVLDTNDLGNIHDRSWLFRSVGYGHGEDWWKDVVTALRLAGYDYVLSIEHEDALMSPREGLEKAVATLKNVVIRTGPANAWWAN